MAHFLAIILFVLLTIVALVLLIPTALFMLLGKLFNYLSDIVGDLGIWLVTLGHNLVEKGDGRV